MGKPDNQPAAEKNMIKPYKEEKPYDLALLDRRPDDLASLVEMNLLRRMRASSPYGASSDTLKPGVRIFFWTILVVLTLSLSFLCILLDSCRPR